MSVSVSWAGNSIATIVRCTPVGAAATLSDRRTAAGSDRPTPPRRQIGYAGRRRAVARWFESVVSSARRALTVQRVADGLDGIVGALAVTEPELARMLNLARHADGLSAAWDPAHAGRYTPAGRRLAHLRPLVLVAGALNVSESPNGMSASEE